MNYNEKLKELTEKFILEMESLKSKNQLLKIEKEKDSARYEETFKLSEDKHNQVKWVQSGRSWVNRAPERTVRIAVH